jgi:hypothetical protein
VGNGKHGWLARNSRRHDSYDNNVAVVRLSLQQSLRSASSFSGRGRHDVGKHVSSQRWVLKARTRFSHLLLFRLGRRIKVFRIFSPGRATPVHCYSIKRKLRCCCHQRDIWQIKKQNSAMSGTDEDRRLLLLPRPHQEEPQRRRRRPFTRSQRAQLSKNQVLENNDALLQNILSYLKNTYRYTAAVNQRFRRNYNLLFVGRHRHTTSYENALASVTTAKIWIREQDPPRGRLFAFSCAAGSGRLDVLHFLRSRGQFYSSTDVCAAVAGRGHLHVLKWLRENGCRWDTETCCKAAGSGHLHILKWARKNGCDWSESTCAFAAGGGHLNVLKWARENGCLWNASTCSYAARGGHLHVLKWARENGCNWHAWTCSFAAGGGHLDVLKWAREEGCDWDASTCWEAARHGHLDVLKWARENDCEWDIQSCIRVAAYNVAIVDWIRANDNEQGATDS